MTCLADMTCVLRPELLHEVLCFLDARSLAVVAQVSRIMVPLTDEAQRRPHLVAKLGPLSEVVEQCAKELPASPSMGILFSDHLPRDPVAAIENAIKTLPPFTTIVGATSSSIQVISHSVALNAHAPHRVRRERGTVVRGPDIRSQHTCPLLHLPPVVAQYETHACIHSSPHAPAARAGASGLKAGGDKGEARRRHPRVNHAGAVPRLSVQELSDRRQVGGSFRWLIQSGPFKWMGLSTGQQEQIGNRAGARSA